MYRVVIDTNVFVSGTTISKGVPSQVMDYWRNQNFVMVISPQLIAEYEEVLARPSVMRYTSLTVEENARYLQEVKDRAYMTRGTLTLNVLTKDPDDNMVLACAEEGLATHLVTGNIKDFSFPEYKGIQIVTPKEFLDLLDKETPHLKLFKKTKGAWKDEDLNSLEEKRRRLEIEATKKAKKSW